MHDKILKTLFPIVKLSGMTGANNRYIDSQTLKDESLRMLGSVPICNSVESYIQFLLQKAEEHHFYAYMMEKYGLTEEQIHQRYTSPSNLYNICSTLHEEE